MLCPECECSCPGGALCPQCGQQVPERESFDGQDGHHLRILFMFSTVSLCIFVLATRDRAGEGATLQRLYATGWTWMYLAVFLIPMVVGLYYWFMLREEEIVITDEYIGRRSRWGDERLAWSDVRAFRRRPTLFQRTRLRHVARLGCLFRKGVSRLASPEVGYELVGSPTGGASPHRMRLEPGTVDDWPWLLCLIEERIGPPENAR